MTGRPTSGRNATTTTGSGGPGPLLSPRAVLTLLENVGAPAIGARPNYLRHKPGESTIVGYEFTTDTGRVGRGYLYWCADPDRSAAALRKSLSLRPRPGVLGLGIVALGPHTVLHEFPNDDRLRRLRWYTDSRKLKRSLGPELGVLACEERLSGSRTTTEVLRYIPERRVVVRIDPATSEGSLPPMLLRYSTSPSGSLMNRLATHLLAHGVPTPEPIAVAENGRVGITRFVSGAEWRHLPADSEYPTEALAAALDSLHRTPPLPRIPLRRVKDDLARVVSGLETLSRRLDGVESLVGQLGRLLSSRTPPDTSYPSVVHGDLHGGNILVDDGHVTLIDLERLAVGDPLMDLGRLVGYADPGPDHTRALTVVESYLRGDGAGAPDATRLSWYTAGDMIDRALMSVRRCRSGWRETAPGLLRSALRELL